jgi:CheY-like chemotaxis protein
MRILIADDDKLCAQLIATLVTAVGHEVVAIETNGGLAVMQSFQKHHPDCVLLDVYMPKYNGFTVAQHLRSREPGVKIVMMSGMVQDDHPSALQCQLDAWLPKPITFEQLSEVLAKLSEPATASPILDQ